MLCPIYTLARGVQEHYTGPTGYRHWPPTVCTLGPRPPLSSLYTRLLRKCRRPALLLPARQTHGTQCRPLAPLLDVRRDPRIAIHRPTIEPPARALSAAPGDAKLAGTVVEIMPPSDDPHEGAGFSGWRPAPAGELPPRARPTCRSAPRWGTADRGSFVTAIAGLLPLSTADRGPTV